MNRSASLLPDRPANDEIVGFRRLRQRGGTHTTMCVRMVFATSRIWQRAWRALTGSARQHYRPEKHYMRGPGPKYRAKRIERNAGKRGSTLTSANDNAKPTTSANDDSKGG